jgi:hypothetical protein
MVVWDKSEVEKSSFLNQAHVVLFVNGTSDKLTSSPSNLKIACVALEV